MKVAVLVVCKVALVLLLVVATNARLPVRIVVQILVTVVKLHV